MDLRRISPHWPELFTAAAFVASRFYYRVVMGLRFDETPVRWFVQYVDPHLLSTDLARSILYLHHQGPLQNLLVGAALKLTPEHGYELLDGVYLALGFVMAVSLVRAMGQLGVRPSVRAVLAALVTASPIAIVYELWLFYHHPVAALMVLSLCALIELVRTKSVAAGALFFGLLATVALTRSTYGLLWVLAVGVTIGILRVAPARVLIRAALLPALVLALFAVKTPLLVGTADGTAILWPNLAKKVLMELTPEERAELVQSGAISSAQEREYLTDLDRRGAIRVPHEPTGVPLLDLDRVSDGRPNQHALEHALIAKQFYRTDALYLLEHHPGAYGRAVTRALVEGFPRSPTSDMCLERGSNTRKVAKLEGRLRELAGRGPKERLHALFVGLPLLFLYGVVRVAARRREGEGSPVTAALGFMLVTIAYVVATTALVSWGDWSRYRFDVDPFFWVMLALVIEGVARRTAALVSRVRGGSSSSRPSETSAP